MAGPKTLKIQMLAIMKLNSTLGERKQCIFVTSVLFEGSYSFIYIEYNGH